MKVLVAICAVLVASHATQLPRNFKRCNRRSPNFDSCLLEAARYGVTQLNRSYPRFNMVNLDPLTIPKIEISVDTPLVNVTASLGNCQFRGLTTAQIEKFEINFQKRTIYLAAVWPELKSQCQFVTDGHVLTAPVKGQGPSSGSFKNFRWTFSLSYEEIKRNGKTYVKPINTKFDGKLEDFALKMDGFFDNDKELAERAEKIVNDNWREIYEDVKIVYFADVEKTWLKIMNGWISKLSLEEAFDN